MYCCADILGDFFFNKTIFHYDLCSVSAPFFFSFGLKTKHINHISDLDPHF